jgi:hypothetical protein
MGHVVARPFKTVNRLMFPGAQVALGDHLEPHDFDILKKHGFVAEEPAPSPAAVRVATPAAPLKGPVLPGPGDA